MLDAAGGRLPETLKTVLDASLADADPVTGFTGLKADPGKAVGNTFSRMPVSMGPGDTAFTRMS